MNIFIIVQIVLIMVAVLLRIVRVTQKIIRICSCKKNDNKDRSFFYLEICMCLLYIYLLYYDVDI